MRPDDILLWRDGFWCFRTNWTRGPGATTVTANARGLIVGGRCSAQNS